MKRKEILALGITDEKVGDGRMLQPPVEEASTKVKIATTHMGGKLLITHRVSRRYWQCKGKRLKIKCNIIYGIVKYGIFPPPLETTLRSFQDMTKLGIKYVELDVTEENVQDFYAAAERISNLCETQGLKVANVTAYVPHLFSLEAASGKRSMKAFAKSVQLASRLSADLVMTDSFSPPLRIEDSQLMADELVSAETPRKVAMSESFSWPRFWKRFTQRMKKCNQVAEQAGHKFCVEPVPGQAVPNTDAMLRLIDAVDSENFGAVFDIASAHYQREMLSLSIRKLRKQLFMIHISDNDGTRNHHLVPGKGNIDWDSILASLKTINFDDYAALDVRAPRDRIDRDYEEARVFVENWIAKS